MTAHNDYLIKGLKRFQHGEFAAAEQLLLKSAAAYPQSSDAWKLLGLIAMQNGSALDAVKYLETAVACAQLNAESWTLYSSALRQHGDFAKAINACRQALALEPNSESNQLNLAFTLLEAGRPDEAIITAQDVISRNPNAKDAYRCQGLALARLGKHAVAVEALQKALALGAKDANTCSALTDSLISSRRNQEAVDVAAKLAPVGTDQLLNMSKALSFNNNDIAAIDTLRAAQSNKKHNSHPMLDPMLAELYLATGKLVDGWSLYRARHKKGLVRDLWRNFRVRTWQGEALEGKTILTWVEQGVADGLWFASVLPELARKAKQVLVECDPRLLSLLQRSIPNVLFFAKSENPEAPPGLIPDFHAPLLDFAGAVRSSLADFAEQPRQYLYAEEDRQQYWRQWLQALGDKPAVGISWRSVQKKNFLIGDSYPTLDIIARLIKSNPDLIWVNLQYDDAGGTEYQQLEALSGVSLHTPPGLDLMNDFEGAAGLISNLRAVVAPANTPGVLAAAMGRPVLALWSRTLRIYWRTHGQAQMPWFPSMQLCRRPTTGEWSDVVGAMHAGLQSLLAEQPPSLNA